MIESVCRNAVEHGLCRDIIVARAELDFVWKKGASQMAFESLNNKLVEFLLSSFDALSQFMQRSVASHCLESSEMILMDVM
jgi:hypothetical protein